MSDRELQETLRRELGENDYVAIGSTWRVTMKDDAYRLIKVRHFRQRLGQQADIQVNTHTGEIYEVRRGAIISRHMAMHGRLFIHAGIGKTWISCRYGV